MKRRLPGRFPDVVLIDDADRIALGHHRWTIDKHGYVQRHERLGVGKYTKVKLHSEIMGFPNLKVDHINGVRTDNRRSNLRLVDDQAHSQNQCLSAANTSGHRGVSWQASSQRWYAYGKMNGRMIGLGLYTDLEDAARVAREFREKNYRGYIDREKLKSE